MEYTVALCAEKGPHDELVSVEMVGGKARNLGIIMRNNKAPIPKGFVITCKALDTFLEANNLNIESCTAEDIVGATLPSTMEQEITSKYASIFGPDTLVAVRSSGVSEDSAEHSFSGMYSSFLNTTQGQLIQKVKECWASSRSERVVQYARATKSTQNYHMGVIIQEMVQSKAAGVVFTMNPVTMDSSYFVVNAAPGLGESLVSGHITPDTYICDKDTGEITSQHLASISPCLPKEALAQLLELAKQIQQIFSTDEGQDIEFAWDGTTVWAVQARPITTATSATHVSRRPLSERKKDICCNHETVDVFPEVITPLTWSTFDYIVHHSMMERYRQKNIKFPQDCSMYELHWGRVYQNLTVADMMVQAEFGINPDTSSQALKGDLWKTGSHSDIPLFERVKGLARLMTSLWDSTATATRMQKVILECSVWCIEKEKELRNIHEISEGVINSLRKNSTAKFCEFGCDYIDINVRLQIFYHATEAFLESAASALGEKVDYFIAALLTDLGGVTTFDMNTHLRHLASIAANNEAVMTFLSGESFDNYRTSLGGTSFLVEFLGFLEKYGYRAINELDASSTRWDEDPSFVFGQILAMAKQDKEGTRNSRKGIGEEKRKKIEELLMAQVPFLQRYITRWAIGKLQDFTRLRENAKCVLVQFISLSRHYLLHAASRFTQRGLLTNADDVFYLTLPDMDELLAVKTGEEGEKGNEFTARVRRSAALVERQKKLAYPELFVGEVPRFASRTKSDEDKENVLTGIGASCGVVHGTARVLHSPNDRHKLLSPKDILIHYILVCASTDPAWTPLFACCSGLVTVYGGMLSHGAIVAREFGIPAVLGVADALAVIKDGMTITVNGNAGEVTILVPK